MKNIDYYAPSRFRHLPKSIFLIYDRQKPWWEQILDPGSEFVNQWNHIFLFACLTALFLDPLYFFLPEIGGRGCMSIDMGLAITVTVMRSIVDLFSLLHIVMKFRTAYVAKNSRIVGRGELVMDQRQIAMRYLKSDFVIDLAATLPLPQILIWGIIPAVKRTAAHDNHTISLIIILQYIPRLLVIFPLNHRIVKTSGVVTKTAWAGAAYNLFLFMLVSHVLGASWYVLSIERQYLCWRAECRDEQSDLQTSNCRSEFLDCKNLDNPARKTWLKSTQVLSKCDPANTKIEFKFGIFIEAFKEDVASATFINKYFYCLWWGMKNLCSYGQNLITSTYILETVFSISVAIGGLTLFSLLIGNMQTYLQSTTARLEEWRVRRRDTEEWMRHRQLPPDLQDRVRRFVQYKWLATRGVNGEEILQALPQDIRRQIQRHLCLNLVRRVPFFSLMDDQLLDAICEHLVSSLSTKDTYIVREGDPVKEMIFIIRGQIESSTTNGGRSGFFNSITLKAGDFCGEELLTWALMPSSNLNFPSSTRTVKSLTEVEAFALQAEDLKFVANQFKRLHSKKLQHAFRYYSHQWRTWGSCFIQAAWRRHKRWKLAMELARQESLYYRRLSDAESSYSDELSGADYEDGSARSSTPDLSMQQLGATILASRFAANTRRGIQQRASVVEPGASSGLAMPKLFKPNEPDFSAEHED